MYSRESIVLRRQGSKGDEVMGTDKGVTFIVREKAGRIATPEPAPLHETVALGTTQTATAEGLRAQLAHLAVKESPYKYPPSTSQAKETQ